MNISDLPADYVRSVLNYDPATGLLTWTKCVAKAVHVGDVAGSADDKGYILVGLRRRLYKAHRLIWLHMTGAWPEGMIDHLNGVKNDNRFANLRVVLADGNSQNVRRPNKRNKSGFIGVIAHQGRWRASITINSKTRRIGDYNTPEEAHEAYLAAKRAFHPACTI